MLPPLSFVLGGAASGKSQWAENLVIGSGLHPVYLATARVFDAETDAKVVAHKARRTTGWRNLEAEVDLPPVLANCGSDEAVLIDCATMWLTNLMMDEADVATAQTRLLDAVSGCAARIVIVSNEVGHGIVPDNALARRFREVQGRLNIALAAQSDLAVVVTAGLPLLLKGKMP